MIQDQAEKLRLLVRRPSTAPLTGGTVVLVWSTRPEIERVRLLDGLRQAVQFPGGFVEIIQGKNASGTPPATSVLRSTGENGESQVMGERQRCGSEDEISGTRRRHRYLLVDISDDPTLELRRLEGAAVALVHAGSTAEEMAQAYTFVKRHVRFYNLKTGILVHETDVHSSVADASRRIRKTCALFLGVRLAALGMVQDWKARAGAGANAAIAGDASLKRAAAWIVAASHRIWGAADGINS